MEDLMFWILWIAVMVLVAALVYSRTVNKLLKTRVGLLDFEIKKLRGIIAAKEKGRGKGKGD